MFLTACLFVIFEISHQSCSPLHSFFEIPKLLKNTGQNWATYFFTITKFVRREIFLVYVFLPTLWVSHCRILVCGLCRSCGSLLCWSCLLCGGCVLRTCCGRLLACAESGSVVGIGGGSLDGVLFHNALVSVVVGGYICLLYTSPSPRDLSTSRMPSSA